MHFAAESHVDRSILSPRRRHRHERARHGARCSTRRRAADIGRFVHVSTDEVYGDIDEPFEADETFPAEAEQPVRGVEGRVRSAGAAYVRTYHLPVIVTRASNNYGPYQFPEKLIPLMISNALEGAPLPVYGDGLQVRDWLYVDDHCRAILAVLERGHDGEVYNVAGACHLPNIEVVKRLLEIVGAPETLITRVTDRPGHDRRYALRGDKIARETGFVPEVQFEDGLARTVKWYQENADWTRRVRSGVYRDYYEKNYAWRDERELVARFIPRSSVNAPSEPAHRRYRSGWPTGVCHGTRTRDSGTSGRCADAG